MAVRWFAGAETGDVLECVTGTPTIETTNFYPGGGLYSYKWLTSSGGQFTSLAGLAAGTLYSRFHFRLDAVTPASVQDNICRVYAGASTVIGIVAWTATSGNSSTYTIQLINFQTGSSVQIGSNFTASYGQWYTIEIKATASATVGVLELKISAAGGGATTVVATGSGLNTGATVFDHMGFGPAAGAGSTTGNMYYDDVCIGDSGYLGDGFVIARQGVAGTPTDTSANWVLVTGATVQACLSHTPTDTATGKITNAVASAVARSMVISPFSAAQVTTNGQSAHGAGIIQSLDVINAVKTSIIGLTSSTTSDPVDSIRRRVPVAAAATDVAMAAWTVAATYRETLWGSIPTYANLNNHEIGVLRGATTTNIHTVQDMWTMVDYSPGTPLPLPVRRSGGNRKRTAFAMPLVRNMRGSRPTRGNLFHAPAAVLGPISLVNNWTGQATGSQTTIAVVTSGGSQAQVGDVLVAVIENFGNPPPTAFASSGWTVQVACFTAGPFLTASVLTKVVTAPDIGATFTFTNGGLSYQQSANISCWRGVDNVTPIDAAGTGSTGSNAAPTAASISPTTANNALIWFATSGSTTNSLTVPGALTSLFNYTGSTGNYQPTAGAYQLNNATGATGAIAGAIPGTDLWDAVLIALRPAPPSTALPAIPRRRRPITARAKQVKARRATRPNRTLVIARADPAPSRFAHAPQKKRPTRQSSRKRNVRNRIEFIAKADVAPSRFAHAPQRKRLSAGSKKRPLRSNLTKKLIPQAPTPVRAPLTGTRQGQKKRIAKVKAKRIVRDNLQLRIPPAPIATAALPIRRANQRKRIPRSRAKRPVNASAQLRIPQAPAAVTPQLPQILRQRTRKRVLRPRLGVRSLRSTLIRLPEASPSLAIKRTRVQPKQIARIKDRSRNRSGLLQTGQAAKSVLPAHRPQRKKLTRLAPKRRLRTNLELTIPSAPLATLPLSVRRPRGQAKRLARVRAKRIVRSSPELRIPSAPLAQAPVPLRRPRGQSRRIPRVTAKPRVRSSIELRIPPAPSARLPLAVGIRRRAVKQIPHVKAKRSVRNSLELRIPSAPTATLTTTARRPGQRKRLPRVKAKLRTRDNLQLRIPSGPTTFIGILPPPVRRAQAQRKRIARVKAKRVTRSNLELRIPPAPTATLPRPILARTARPKRRTTTTKRIVRRNRLSVVSQATRAIPPQRRRPRATLKRPINRRRTGALPIRIPSAPVISAGQMPPSLRTRPQKRRVAAIKRRIARNIRIQGMTAATAPSMRRTRPQKKRLARAKVSRITRSIIELRIPSAPAPRLPIAVRRPQGQKKRIAHVKAKRTTRSSVELRAMATIAAPTPFRHRGQKRRIPLVKAKKIVRSSAALRIPAAPRPQAPVPIRRPRGQTKRLPHTKAKPRLRNSVQLLAVTRQLFFDLFQILLALREPEVITLRMTNPERLIMRVSNPDLAMDSKAVEPERIMEPEVNPEIIVLRIKP
jgi:hypothetical protein